MLTISAYEWNGPEYNTVTNASTSEVGKSTTKKQGKALKIGAGALLGSLVAPGVGTLVGAAMGAGSKGKEKNEGHKTTKSTADRKNVEKRYNCIFFLVNDDTKRPIKYPLNATASLMPL